jgi:hypothetical protein
VFDTESLNAEKGFANVGHQYAVSAYDGLALKEIAHDGLEESVLKNGLMPDQTLLNKYFDPAKFTYEEQVAKYLETRAGTAKSEEDLFFGYIQKLWDNVKDTYDGVAKQYNAVFVTHNGEDFDMGKLILPKIQQYNMYNRLRKAGIDINFLHDVPMCDTLKIMRKAKNISMPQIKIGMSSKVS